MAKQRKPEPRESDETSSGRGPILAGAAIAVAALAVGFFALKGSPPAERDGQPGPDLAAPSPEASAAGKAPAASSPSPARPAPAASPAAAPAGQADEAPEAFAARYYAAYNKSDGLALARLLDRDSRAALMQGQSAQKLVTDLEDKLLATVIVSLVDGEREVLSQLAVADVQKTASGATVHAKSAGARGAGVALELVVEEGHWRAHLDEQHAISGVVQKK